MSFTLVSNTNLIFQAEEEKVKEMQEKALARNVALQEVEEKSDPMERIDRWIVCIISISYITVCAG